MAQIIEDTANRLYAVEETGDAALAHVWFGIEVKRIRGAYVPKKNARRQLVRKEATRVVAEAA